MKWLTVVVRTLLGALFIMTGAIYFYPSAEMPPPPEGHASQFMGALAGSGYFTAIKVLEIVGGLMLLTGLFPLLGVLILGPIIVNICLYHVFMTPMEGQEVVMTILLPVLLVLVIVGYRDRFAPLFCPRPSAR